MDRVSVCIPSYRQPDKLLRCLNSVFAQTLNAFEVIVTDDTPDDSVRLVVESFQNVGPIAYFHNPCAKGTPENWNEALRRASGELIILLHQDDWFYDSHTLEVLVASISSSSYDLAFARSFDIDTGMKIVSVNDPDISTIQKFAADPRQLFFWNIFGAPSAVIFRNKGFLFDTRLKWLVDVEFYIRYLEGRTWTYAREAILGIGIGDWQVTKSCLGKLDVEFRENVLVYHSLRHPLRHVPGDYRHFTRLFSRFSISINTLLKFNPGTIVVLFYCVYCMEIYYGKIIGISRAFFRRVSHKSVR